MYLLLVQRSLITGILMVMFPGTSVQLAGACLLSLIWLFFSLQLYPHKDTVSHNLHVFSQLVLTTTFLMGECTHHKAKRERAIRVYGKALVVIVVVIFIG